ncbi:MAG TPA: TonB-dependent receptor [Steroidobacteraceae bacterium]|nr:TonB-dependent receptor [Steroidobacteraceae bacterium]
MNFHIPPSDLPTALVLFSRQADLQVVSAADQVSQWMTAGVDGRYTPAQALAMLLTSTGLEYRITATGVVTIGHFSPSLSIANPEAVASRLTASTGAGAPDPAATDPPAANPVASDAAVPGAVAPAAAAPDAATTAQTSAAADTLQEVVVTAERRATDIQTTPISVVAVSGDQLTTTHIADINSLNQVSPSLLIYNTGQASTADIRGIGNSNQGGIEQPGVLIVRDGLPDTSEGFGENIPFYDIADVEVLRGPQGTFAGDNSTGGAIMINSQNPDFGGYSGYVNAQVATYSDQRFQGAVNLPVSDTLAMRFAFNEETQGSFFHDLTTQVDGPNENGANIPGTTDAYSVSAVKTVNDPGHIDNRDGRLSFLWKPSNNFQSLTKLEFAASDGGGIPEQPDVNNFAPLGPGLPCPKGEGTAPNCHGTYALGYSGSPYVLNNWNTNLVYYTNTDAYSEQLQYTLPSNIQLRLVAGDQNIYLSEEASTSDDSLDVGSYSVEPQVYHVYSTEFDAVSPSMGPFSWIAGASWIYNDNQKVSYSVNTASPYSPTAPATGGFIDGNYIWQRSEGVFGQVSWQFTPTLQLVAGAREGWDTEPAKGCSITARPGLSTIINCNIYPPVDRVPTGKLDLNWTPLPGQFFYAFVARGYKPGEENLGPEQGTHYEWVNDYELGWKGRLAGGHVTTQLGGYYMQYYDLIEAIFNRAAPSSTADGNVPYSNVKGIEFSMQAQAAGFALNVSAAVNKSVLGPLVDAATYKFPVGYGTTPQCAPGVTPLPGNTNCTNYTPYIVTLSGEALPYAPEFTANASIQYTFRVGDVSLQPRVTDAYMSTSYASLFQSDNYFQMPSHSLYGANLSLIVGPWTLTAYGTNLANKLYLQNISASGELYGNSRQVGLTLNRTF